MLHTSKSCFHLQQESMEMAMDEIQHEMAITSGTSNEIKAKNNSLVARVDAFEVIIFTHREYAYCYFILVKIIVNITWKLV